MVLEVLMGRFELFRVNFRDPRAIPNGKPRTVPVVVEQIGALVYFSSSWGCSYYRGVGRDVLKIDCYIFTAVYMDSIRCILVSGLQTWISHRRLILSGVGPTSAYLHS